MNLDKIKEILNKIPYTAILVAFLGYLAWDCYTFLNDAQSPLLQKQGQIESIKKENAGLQVKIRAANDFFHGLDAKRAELRALAVTLDEMKGTLSESLDIPSFVKMVVTEAAKVGLKVMSIKPTDAKKSEYYIEQAFDLSFRAVYVQLVLFIERLSNVERIVRVDNFDIHRTGSSISPYVELGGTIQIKTYRYLGSKADDVAKNGGTGSTPPAPAASTPNPTITPTPGFLRPGGGR
ncbi:MAG: type 4a pilus biogenesis protein PilO [Bdellovibrionota bacterium]